MTTKDWALGRCVAAGAADDKPTNAMRLWRGTVAAVVLAVLCTVAACSSSTTPHPPTTTTTTTPSTTPQHANLPDGPPGSWRLVFSDHFRGASLDTKHWSTCYHWGCTNGGNKELEVYQASQVTVHDGTVSLTVVPRRTLGKEYVSGMLSSYRKFSFRYGYVQIVAKLPLGRGLWSAFWTEPESGVWPPEIDIMENVAQSDSVSLYIHYDAADHFDSSTVYLPNASSTFHTFGVDWEPGSITWYVDGFRWAHFNLSITQPEYLIADLAVNGRVPPNSAVRFPQSLVIRSVEVWQHPARSRTTPQH